ncbi:MAG: heavy metal translocating P-type ATPase [Syntrophobacteraceae bacterium]|nr:heavy metal translocating P-type ATPase [Syntrophobacteraceae bacterium]
MEKHSFRIKGMCCGEEVGLLRSEIAPLVGADNLSFDLLASLMTVSGQLDPKVSDKVLAAVARTGMAAVSLDGLCAAGVCPVAEESLWEKHGRFFSCVAGAALLAGAFFLQALRAGDILAALTSESAAPRLAVALYFLSILAGGWFVLPRALYAAKKLKADMNLLMMVAVLGAIVLGKWLEAASVTFLFSLALLLESWSLEKAKREIAALLDIAPRVARFICPHDGQIEEKPVDQIAVGTTVVVRPGEQIPLDGVITRGTTCVNQAPITGEAAAIAKEVGAEVFAGTINEESSIEFRTTRLSSDTTLSRIIRMVEESRSRRAPAEQWVDKFARVYTPLMMIVALAIAVVPPLFTGAGWAPWFYQGLVVLVIACPCALVISTPVTIVAGLGSAARNGVLVKGGACLEAPARIRAVAFDKTGTITYGQPAVKQVMPVGNHSETALMANAAALEVHSTHPVARAIMRHAQSLGISPPVAENFTVLPGQGAEGSIGGRTYWIGSHRMLERWRRESPVFHDEIEKIEEAGNSLMVMWCDDHICGLVTVADQVRPEARGAVAGLKALGLQKVVMISGDNRKTAGLIAKAVGVDEFHAELLPADKVRLVSQLEAQFGHIAMVGDGINDAPALAAASLGIAMGAMGSDAAIETSDIALMSDDLAKIPWLIRHSKKTMTVIRQNIFFALFIKCLFIAMAAAGMASLWEAIAADMGASLIVIFNGLRMLAITGQDRYGTKNRVVPAVQ